MSIDRRDLLQLAALSGSIGTDQRGLRPPRNSPANARQRTHGLRHALCAAVVGLAVTQSPPAHGGSTEAASACHSLTQLVDLTITFAELRPASGTTPEYCYTRGVITPNIRYHLQLPLPDAWNGRFLQWGDGGKDGDLDFADHRLAQGYAVANSNTGHDVGSEPGASFGFNNRQAEIDFGYRAVHLTATAARHLIRAYYGQPASYAYHEGCSTGGRQGLMEAQRFPDDFDGIVAGAPVNFYQQLNLSHVWMLQRSFADNFAGVPYLDRDGDGQFDDRHKLEILHQRVLKQCDALDGIKDGVLNDPLACDFDPDRDLSTCRGDGPDCFTPAQIRLIKDYYRGAYDSKGVSILKGLPVGSELGWTRYFPDEDNDNFPFALLNASNHGAYLFYEQDPGVPVPNPIEITRPPNRDSPLPEWAWWQFNIDDVTAGKGDFMKAITNAEDPNLKRFLLDNGGKLILYHGWLDVGAHPEPTVDYYQDVVDTTFQGDMQKTREHARLFMFPGMGHCGGGPGPDEWDPLAPLVAWVEHDVAPEAVIATHRTNAVVDNERPVCAHPERTVYDGPRQGADNPTHWVAKNFRCVMPTPDAGKTP
jgi:hypothetical protein